MSMRASLVALVTLLLAVPSAASASGPTVSNQDLSVSATVSVPLVTGGVDSVPLTGVIHASTWQSSMDAQGKCRLRFHANAAGVSGIGAATGLQYLLVGASDSADFDLHAAPDDVEQPVSA